MKRIYNASINPTWYPLRSVPATLADCDPKHACTASGKPYQEISLHWYTEAVKRKDGDEAHYHESGAMFQHDDPTAVAPYKFIKYAETYDAVTDAFERLAQLYTLKMDHTKAFQCWKSLEIVAGLTLTLTQPLALTLTLTLT